MAGEVWRYTGRKYKDGIEVPYLTYKCKSTATAPPKDGRVETTHACKIHVDHDGDHICLCEKRWPNSQSTKENTP